MIRVTLPQVAAQKNGRLSSGLPPTRRVWECALQRHPNFLTALVRSEQCIADRNILPGLHIIEPHLEHDSHTARVRQSKCHCKLRLLHIPRKEKSVSWSTNNMRLQVSKLHSRDDDRGSDKDATPHQIAYCGVSKKLLQPRPTYLLNIFC